ncbi:MAG TPA: NAD(P)/FAD-dependent oxidoreductase [Acidimicrobiales bacterium]|nr:NAD(P)/FAD-dependent oxidoreductase [Acidimicrobiales bacterium]
MSRNGGADPVRFVIIGGGMAGILSAVKLREAGFNDITIYEKADRLGGTWRENTYPGVACDVPSHLYSYSFAPNADWSQVFSGGAEILAYLETVAQRFGVEKYMQFGTEVTKLAFVDGRWRITTNAGDDVADVVIAATGVLHHPAYPDIAGLDTFAGPTFHSARWNHSVPLSGARVGVIGTGSSAVQITSALAGTVDQFVLFQRTPQWVLPVPNPPIDADTRSHFHTEPAAMASVRADLATMFEENFANAVVDRDSPQVKALQVACTANLEENVADPALREKLRPGYPAACKRLIVCPDFYQALQRPGASLVTETITGIEPGGVRTDDGVLHELDVLVLATGFRVDRFLRPIEVVGRGGVALDELWHKRPWAYLAISVPEFPNLFMLNGPNGPVGNFSLIDVAEMQFGYIMQLVDQICAGVREVSPTMAAATRFEEERTEAAKHTIWVTGCRSWYLDDRGIPAVWPWTFSRFRQEMAAPDVSAYELVR